MNEELRDKRGLSEYTLNLNNVIQQLVSDWNSNVVFQLSFKSDLLHQKIKNPL